MATFSMGDALGSGFGLIGRRPFSVLAWGLAYLVLAVLPALALFAWAGPDFLSFFHQIAAEAAAGRSGAPPDFAAMAPLQAKIMMFQPLIFLSSLVGRAVLAGAIFRAVLEPQNSGFAFLRIGKQEVWLGLLMVAFTILAVIFVIAVCVGGLVVGGVLAAALAAAKVAKVWIVLADAGVGLIALVLTIWIFVRFSLAFPMTFAEREFRLFESWRVTKGHAWQLFGLGLLLVVIVAAIVAVLEGSAVAVVLAAAPGIVHAHGQLEAFFRQPPETWLRTLAPWAALALLVGAYLTAALTAIMLAPWASAYTQITGGPGAAPAPAAPDHGAPGPPTDGHGHDDHGRANAHGGHDDHGHGDHQGHDDGHGHGGGHGGH